MNLPNRTSTNIRAKRNSAQDGYILLALMLVVAVLAIAALTVYPDVIRQAKRDQEEELIHRGVQYARAVRKYYKKFNRYPNSIDDLVITNNIRFLRKKYKDPVTGKDFKILHQQDVQFSFPGGGIGGQPGVPPGLGGRPGLPGQPGFPGQPGGAGGFGGFGLPGSPQPPPNPDGPDSSSGDPVPPTNGPQGTGLAGTGGVPPAAGGPTDAAGGTGDTSGDPPNFGSFGPPQNGAAGNSGNNNNNIGGGSGQGFGGGAMLGVVSMSKAKTIREFSKKNHYNEWQFIYDPGQDRGGLLNSPVVPGQTGQLGGTALAPGSTGAGKTDSSGTSTNPLSNSPNTPILDGGHQN